MGQLGALMLLDGSRRGPSNRFSMLPAGFTLPLKHRLLRKKAPGGGFGAFSSLWSVCSRRGV